jgi:hypothetical protein
MKVCASEREVRSAKEIREIIDADDWRARREDEEREMRMTDAGRRAVEMCARKQRGLDALPEMRSGPAIRIRKLDDDDDEQDDDGRFRARVIVNYMEEYQVEKVMLDVVVRLRACASALCAGGTPPRRANVEEDADEHRGLEELACVLGEEVKDVETRISDKNRKMPLIPKRFRQLLGLRRVYEVDGVDASAVCSAVRMFLLRVASGGKWTHWGMIEGPVTVELPLRNDFTFVDLPEINPQSSLFVRERVMKPIFDERHAMIVYVNGANAPSEGIWNVLESMNVLQTLIRHGTRVCLCWPMDVIMKSARMTSKLQLSKFTRSQLALLETSPDHWRSRLSRAAKDFKVKIHGDMAMGIGIAFVRTAARASQDRDYSVRRLGYAIECQLSQIPDEARSDIKDGTSQPSSKDTVVGVPAIEANAEDPPETPLKLASSKPKSPMPKMVVAPLSKQPKKRKRQCTIPDPFSFDEDDRLYKDEETATPQVFGKHVAKKVRPPLGTIASNSRTKGADPPASRQPQPTKDNPPIPTAKRRRKAPAAPAAPKPKLMLSKPPRRPSPRQSLAPTSVDPPPRREPNLDKRVQPSRAVRAAPSTQWWEQKSFTWERD